MPDNTIREFHLQYLDITLIQSQYTLAVIHYEIKSAKNLDTSTLRAAKQISHHLKSPARISASQQRNNKIYNHTKSVSDHQKINSILNSDKSLKCKSQLKSLNRHLINAKKYSKQ